MSIATINHGHLFCGLGGGARGFRRSTARVGQLQAHMRCVGGIDVDAAAVADFGRLAGAPGTVMDLMSRGQYIAFHGHAPPDGWREMLPADIRGAMLDRPHVWFLSAPCKGFSGLTSEAKSLTPRYQALNELTLRGIWLALEAYADDPVEFVLFENVPRIASRGRHLVDQIVSLLRHYGYAVAETTHDCGELGGLAQSRKRFLLVARHIEKVPPFLYEPRTKPLRGVGEVLGRLPMPGSAAAGALHRLPALQWRTWVRLAFVEAGKDWRSLQRLAVADGFLRDYGIVPTREYRNDFLGVRRWDEHTGVVAGESLPNNGAFSVADPRPAWDNRHGNLGLTGWGEPSRTVTGGGKGPQGGALSVADPRIDGHAKSVQHGVLAWDQPSGVVTGTCAVGGGAHAVQDPRVDGIRHNNVFRVVRFDETSPSVTAGGHPTSGGLGVADPRCAAPADSQFKGYRVVPWDGQSGVMTGARSPAGAAQAVADPRCDWKPSAHESKFRVADWEQPSRTIIAATRPGSGALSVADPRPRGLMDKPEGVYATAGAYGIVPWGEPAGAIAGALQVDNGRGAVADIRLPAAADSVTCVIVAEDGTWHRPFTTLDMAALQSLLDPEEWVDFRLCGRSDSAIRERIGNAVPSDAAEAMGSVIARTLLLAWTGETFVLSTEPIWVREQIAAIQCGSA